MERAILRQALAEWRDRQIVGAAALVNLKAIEARAAFDQQLEDVAVSDSLFNPTGWASTRVDALMRNILTPALDAFLAAAADEVAAIDGSLAAIADALRRRDLITMPAPEPGPAEADEPVLEEAAPGASDTEGPSTGGWLDRVRGRVTSGAVTLATNTAAAADTFVGDGLGHRARLRAAAALRVATYWMGDTGEPKPVRAQLIALIDEAAYAARTRLS